MVVSVMVLEIEKGSVLLTKTTSPTTIPSGRKGAYASEDLIPTSKEAKEATHSDRGNILVATHMKTRTS